MVSNVAPTVSVWMPMAFNGSTRAMKAGVVPVLVQCTLPVNDLTVEWLKKNRIFKKKKMVLQNIGQETFDDQFYGTMNTPTPKNINQRFAYNNFDLK